MLEEREVKRAWWRQKERRKGWDAVEVSWNEHGERKRKKGEWRKTQKKSAVIGMENGEV